MMGKGKRKRLGKENVRVANGKGNAENRRTFSARASMRLCTRERQVHADKAHVQTREEGRRGGKEEGSTCPAQACLAGA
eukprot:3141244-Rhodomonas_salina.1